MKSAHVDRSSTQVGDSQGARPSGTVGGRGGRPFWRGYGLGILTAVIALSALALATRGRWLPDGWTSTVSPHTRISTERPPGDHAADGNAGHDEAEALELSEQARKDIGLTLHTVERREFERSVMVPAVISERPGRSAITVSAPITGIVTRIYPTPGEAVAPGDLLFNLRLTHEDLVDKQSELLRDLEQLDVVKQEVERLEGVTRSGAVAGKALLERVYDQQKVEGAIRAAREALLLHGLSEEQIETVRRERRLIRQIVVTAPEPDEAHSQVRHEDFLQVSQLAVKRGDHVITGTPLLTLTDHCLLYIVGQAFEHDAEDLNRAANEGLPVSIRIQTHAGEKQTVSGLRVLYVENEVERDSRALKFYVQLPNEVLRNELTPDQRRFIAWRYRPGQRVEVLVPIQRWENRLVLPVESVIQDGVASFVFQLNGEHFDRQPVHVEFRDQQWVVVEDDGTLHPGDQVAAKGAYQIHLAIKNTKAAPDPHAGHQH